MTERELERHAAHRLAIIRHAQELTGNVSKTCRYYGISRQVYYKWLRRYEEGGLEALCACVPPAKGLVASPPARSSDHPGSGNWRQYPPHDLRLPDPRRVGSSPIIARDNERAAP